MEQERGPRDCTGDRPRRRPGPPPRLPATFFDDRRRLDWDRGQPLRSGRTVSGIIGAFHPKDLPEDLWERIQAFVREMVTVSVPARPFMADNRMAVVAQFAAWADRIGLPLDADLLFDPETIDRFLIEGPTHLKMGSRLNYRTQLWKVGRAVVGPELFPPKPPPMQRSEVLAPYDAAEITALVSWARGLSTEHRRRNARALLAVGLGAGLTPEEIQRLVGSDVRRDGGFVVVEVPGRRPRSVPVLKVWADEVWGTAQESGERPFFCPERRRIVRNDVLKFIEAVSEPDGTRFTILRLRVTWIVYHLTVGTNLRLAETYAGVGAGQLVKYLHHVPLPEVDPVTGYRPRGPTGAGQ